MQHLTFLIPDFYEDLDTADDESMPLPPMDEDDELFLEENNDETSHEKNSLSSESNIFKSRCRLLQRQGLKTGKIA